VENSSKIICKNCDASFEGLYCPMCRQSAKTDRITWKEIIDHLFTAQIEVDKGFFHTVRKLFLTPGKTISDYLGGKRAYFFNPVMFVILLGGTASILFITFHINILIDNINIGSIEETNPILAHKHFTFIGTLMLLFLTVSDFIIYRPKYKLPELFISNAFQIGELLFFLIIALPFLFLQNQITLSYETQFEIRYLLIAGIFCYLFLVRYQFYQAKKKYFLQLKIILQLILLYVAVKYSIEEIMINIKQ
jgi:hypothetical protein